MQSRTPALRGPSKPRPQPTPKPEDRADAPVSLGLHVMFPMPAELAADAVTFAGRLLEAVEKSGVRLNRADRACCEEVLFLSASGAAMAWGSAGRVLKIARLHLAPPV